MTTQQTTEAMAGINPIEAIHRERERLLKIKAELSIAAGHAMAAAWRVGVFHPDRPMLINRAVLSDLERLSQLIGLHWVFVLDGHAPPQDRPLWSCTALPADWGLEHLAVLVGVFPSLSQARKNGWNGPPVAGFHKEGIGPNRIHRVLVV